MSRSMYALACVLAFATAMQTPAAAQEWPQRPVRIILAFSPGVVPGSIGRRESFADIGQTIARHLGIAALAHGKSWL